MSLLPFEVLQVSRITMNRRYSWIYYIYIAFQCLGFGVAIVGAIV
jgi:hypothetical protein